MKKMLYSLLLAVSFAVYGCGGGGGGDSGGSSTHPTVSSVSPTSASTGVALDTTVSAVFSTAMDSTTITTSSFTLAAGSTSVAGTVSYNSTTHTATFTPSANLSSNTAYTATILSTVRSSGNESMEANYSWSFTTGTSVSTVSFSSTIQPIFTTNCLTGCHQTGGISSFLILTSGSSYNNLVNALATNTTSGTYRVQPFNSASSVLYQRVSGVGLQAGKTQMPQGASPLSSTDQTNIKNWIDQGALNN